jgi:hypothetical protein
MTTLEGLWAGIGIRFLEQALVAVGGRGVDRMVGKAVAVTLMKIIARIAHQSAEFRSAGSKQIVEDAKGFSRTASEKPFWNRRS